MADITAGLITNVGKKNLNAKLYDSDADSALYLAYGTGTTAAAAANEALGTEVDRAKADTAKKVGSDFVIEHEFTVASACTISEIGVFDDNITTSGTPICTGGTTYYMVWDADYTVSTANYIWVVGRSLNLYSDGSFYFINSSNAWADQSVDAMFKIYGQEVVSGTEELLVDNSSHLGTDNNFMLRYNAARTKYAQSFKLSGTDDYYITRVEWRNRKIGSPTGDTWIEIHNDQSGTQNGVDSDTVDVSGITIGWENKTRWDVEPATGGGNLIYRAVAAVSDRETMAAGETYKATVTLTPEAGSY